MFALTGNLALDFGLLFGAGIANMVFVIPSQVLFQQRTPAELIGRVVELPVRARLRLDDDGDGDRRGPRPRSSASRRCSWSAGVVSVVAGLAGLLVPAMRDA